MTIYQIVGTLLGSLGVLLIGGCVFGQLLAVLKFKPKSWRVMSVVAIVYLILFITEPPAALGFVFKHKPVEFSDGVRMLALAVFLALLTRSYIRSWQRPGPGEAL
jgi:Ca2+/Na+ antiporter